MADKDGVIRQFKGPFPSGYVLNLQGNCKVSVSIGQKDFMKYGSQAGQNDKKSFQFILNNELIYMGRSGMYETDSQLNTTVISFPEGAPSSVIVDVVYCERDLS